MIYKKQDNETAEEFILRVAKDKDMIGTWNDVAEILNSELEVSHDESTYRKKYNALKAKIQELDIDDEDDVNGYPLPGMITETDGEITKLR